MHLTDFAVGRSGGAAKGDTGRGPDRAGTLRLAADLTHFAPAQLRTDHVANICGGAAVLASYQPGTTSQRPADWTEAVASYAGTAEKAKMVQYAGQVFDVLRSGATETTDLGDTVTLAAQAGAQPDRAGLEAAGALEPGIDELECPDTIECEAIEALYVQTDPDQPQGLRQLRPRRPRERRDHRLPGRARHRVRLRGLRPLHPDPGPLRVLAVHRSAPPTGTSPSTSRPTTWPRTPATGTSTCTRSVSSTRGTPRVRAAGTPTRSTGRPPSSGSTSPRSTASSSTGPTSSATRSSSRPTTSGTRARTGTGSATWSSSAHRSAPRARLAARSSR